MLKDFQRQRLYEAVAEELKSHISRARLQEGDKLPSEPELCGQLNVSRTTLREAIRLLQTIGILEVKRGRGTYVRKHNVEEYLNHAMPPTLTAVDEIVNLVEVREALEVLAVQLAVERRTEEHLESLKKQLESDREKMARGEYDVEDDLQFHRIVFDATNNEILHTLISIIEKLMNTVQDGRLDLERGQATLAEHTAIYEGLRDRELSKAVRMARAGIRGTGDAILRQLDQRD